MEIFFRKTQHSFHGREKIPNSLREGMVLSKEQKNSAYYPPYHRPDLQFSRKDHFKGITIIGYINI